MTPWPDPAAALLLQIGTSYLAGTALHVALRLDIADRLSEGPRRVDDIAEEAGVDADALYRILRALSSIGVFREAEHRVFDMTSLAAPLRRGEGTARDLLVWITDPIHLDACRRMGEALANGDSRAASSFFRKVEQDEQLLARFHAAMSALSRSVMPAVLEACDFSGTEKVVDVGGGRGDALTAVLRRYTHLRGVLYDRPSVIATARDTLMASEVAIRCEAVAGDFLSDVPAGADTYLMIQVLHDWDDSDARTILQNTHAALQRASSGRLLIIESLIQPPNARDPTKFMDLNLWLVTGGRERTLGEFAKLLAESGFWIARHTATRSPLTIIEARLR